MVKKPKIGEKRLDNLSELKNDSVDWITKEINKNIKQNNTH